VLELTVRWVRAKPGLDDGAVPWPCRTEELEQRIEDALCAAAATATGGGGQEEEGS
jgi:hypothetical protein